MVAFKKKSFLTIGAVAALMACGLAYTDDSSKDQRKNQQEKGDESQPGKSESDEIDMQKLSEAFGNFIGRNLKSNGIEFNLEAIIKGMREGAIGKPAPLNEQEYEKMMTKLQEKAFNALADSNLKAANEFLEINAHAEGVVELVPGKLQYVILTQGNGPAIQEHGTPSVKYTGKYIDDTVFGSSDESGGPITVPLDQTIPGFSKGIVGMKEGEKRRLFVHPELGYGRAGHLAPNSLLIFEIEAVSATSPERTDSDPSSAFDNDDELDDDLDGDQESDQNAAHTHQKAK